ncbi:hypothetical protein BD626DRAFT_569153 [Schizophyllum amplum]|uniref:Uncharacterized protein n=1 Tax=Schizophyllum amplum TaxID=97359 RepID=A0A550CE68_9AGAR|nr:hypothetical protein BD626DRAFT_569153 [Auriculariopsis ampla]
MSAGVDLRSPLRPTITSGRYALGSTQDALADEQCRHVRDFEELEAAATQQWRPRRTPQHKALAAQLDTLTAGWTDLPWDAEQLRREYARMKEKAVVHDALHRRLHNDIEELKDNICVFCGRSAWRLGVRGYGEDDVLGRSG